MSQNAASTSAFVMIPTSFFPSTTGTAPSLLLWKMSSASSTVSHGLTVITSRVMISSTVLFFTTILPVPVTVVSSNVELRMSVPDTKPISSPPSTTGS